MAYGRGGAGNYEAAAQAQQAVSEDVEAQRSQPQSEIPRNVEQPTTAPSNLSQEYAHMGRGGSGNWYSPKELQTTGNFSNPAEHGATTQAARNRASMIAPAESRPRGRGGAGNLLWTEEQEQEEREKAVREQEIELKDMVLRDVEKGLQMPGKAFHVGRVNE